MPSGKIRSSTHFHNFLFLLLIFLISLWSLKPILNSPGRTLVDAGDDILITWIINQNIQKIPYDLDAIFEGNIFYPYKNTLSYSEHFLPSAILSFLPVKISGLPILAYNFNLIFGQIATVTVLYLWFSEMTKDKFSSFVAATALGVSQIRIFYFAHLQMWNMQWWLIALWMIWRFRTYSKVKHLYLAGIFSAIQFWESVLPLYFIFFGFLLMFFSRMKTDLLIFEFNLFNPIQIINH